MANFQIYDNIFNFKNVISNDNDDDDSINDNIQTNKHLAFDNEYEILLILKDIVQGMCYLHNIGVVHGDLKLDNILVKSKSSHAQSEPFQCKVIKYFFSLNFALWLLWKIGDFGSVKMCKNDRIIKNKTYITANYTAPEIFTKNVYTQKSDVYAFGLLTWELITGKRAFENFKKHEIIFRVLNFYYHLFLNTNLMYDIR